MTISVSFLYGTKIAWVCGRKCSFKEEPENKKQALYERIPASTAIYFFGFLIVFSLCMNGLVMIVVSSLVCAVLLSSLVVSMAMPELKRKPPTSEQ